ncbi:MAG: protein kinase, partial [Planctomycetes bacterium]|nr:protein kinase [Planctomycetota bacterium]
MSVDPNRAKSIFLSAVQEHTPEQWGGYLDEVCQGDAQLRRRVEALLAAHQGKDRLLDDPAAVLMGPLDPVEPMEAPGTVIGRYKLLEKIGEGGMAVVYMAEQTEPIRRKVALKIIKLGMDTRQVIARFEAERQALALMDHPCIAKVLDAGATETGRPYFVMELVQGVSITEYCDKNSLSTKDRLILFLQVCHAVQHAHQKGIIHRDIKPSNVMVTHHDGKPVPKVIDFGIAKATNQKLTEKTLFTRYAHIIGTPTYMSPEQAELSDLDIDTRSDIYSLGVLLYELLTGTTPFSEEELRKVSYVEMQRVIREQEPVKPSTRIRTATRERRSVGAGPRACPTSGGHGGPPLQEVRGDLDWIVMKSLEKDRARRYETASGLAEDIRRHLESEPVLARGPSTTYRLRKFLRRHRVQVLVGVVMASLVAIAGVLLSLWNQDRLQWNRDRLQLVEAERLQHEDLLDRAQDQYAKAEREAALKTIQPILDSPHVGGQAQLLRAGILVDNRRFDEATAILKTLLDGRREIAGAAHVLMVRVLRENGDLDAQKLQEIEEHRRQAADLLPKTAEAYFLQAMTALTVKEQLGALDEALRLDAKHYESRRLRAFTYYASRQYGPMNDDASVMEALRDRDPLGYSLHATALHELGRYKEAIAKYDAALAHTPEEDPQYLDLVAQRCETLLRMGRYEDAIAGARGAGERWPDRPVFQYHLFCALTALGEYEKADAVFRQIVGRTPTARNEFWFWATKYVFDTLEAGRSWHPPDHEPVGAAFLPMIEAEKTYHELSAKSHRVVTNGFSAQWSPDGKKLAFSLGVHGYSGVALFDPVTREIELLIVPGKDPRWSPDGRYIAFVRDCQALRLEELTATERKDRERWREDEEIWVMNADGTRPRRLARGGWPSWGKDSTLVYYHSRLDSTLYSISIAPEDGAPSRIMACPSAFPSVSPDNQRVAYLEDRSLKVKDLASQAVVAEWRVPLGAWDGPAWSPTGRELCLGAGSTADDRTGLWIYPLDSNEPAKVLTGQIMAASWAPDGTKLVFALRPPYFELWTADLGPALSTTKALGPGQTLAEHWQDMLRLYTRRIETDPHDAYAYSDRARYYDYLHERVKAEADVKRWSAVMSGRPPWDLWFGTSRAHRRVVDLPFDYELVFSAERPVNAIPTMSIALGQKGRCEMKLFEIPIVVTSLVALCFLAGLDTPPARADFTFGTPTNLGPAINSSAWEGGPYLPPDGLELYFSRGATRCDIWVARRATRDSEWEPATNIGAPISSADNGQPFLTADGLTLLFDGNRPGTCGSFDLWMTTRATKNDSWGPPVNLGPTVNSSAEDWGASLSADGLDLYFTSNRAGGLGSYDLWMTTRATVNDNWGTPTNLGLSLNTPYNDTFPSISPDGLVLFFASTRPGGFGTMNLYMTRRATRKAPWGPPTNLGPTVNSNAIDNGVRVSADGSALCFFSNRQGGFGNGDIWQAPIIPILDFNGDGKVDEKDLALLLADWGKSNSVCDIGPFAWGDSVVDEKDLGVLMKSLVAPGPGATDVSCDVVLSWTLASLFKASDVYFGTSQEAVTNASRTDAQGVLVSKAQVGTTYDPADPLEYSQTYYWRVDFVIPGPTPA